MLKYPTGTEGQAHKLLRPFLFPTGHAFLQDGTDAGAHWPTHNFYSLSLHTGKGRYLNYFKIIKKKTKVSSPKI